MAKRGIVVVTFSHRLGIFGFFSHPELSAESPQHASGNYALMDQTAALQRRNWVIDRMVEIARCLMNRFLLHALGRGSRPEGSERGLRGKPGGLVAVERPMPRRSGTMVGCLYFFAQRASACWRALMA